MSLKLAAFRSDPNCHCERFGTRGQAFRANSMSGARSPASAILTKPFQSPSRHTD